MTKTQPTELQRFGLRNRLTEDDNRVSNTAMIRVGILKIDFHLPESGSLKEKRFVLRKIRDKIRNNFNVSICEADNHDKWQLASFGISCVANDKKHIDATLNKVRDFFGNNRHIVVIDYRIEIV